MDFWDLLKALFGGGFSVDSPRILLIKYVFDTMMNPAKLQLEFQKYYDWLGTFLWFPLAFLSTEGVVRIFRGAKNGQLGYQLKQWAYSVLFFTVGFPLVPGLLVSARALANAIGKSLIVMFADGDVAKFLAQLSSLTGVGPIDFVIGLVQLVFLFQLALSLIAIPVIFVASCVLFLIGVTVRWWGDTGDDFFRLSITVTVFGVCGNAVLMVIVGFGVAIGKVFYPGDVYAQAMINTLVIIIAGSTTFYVLKRFGHRIKTIGQAAQNGLQGLRGKMHGGSTTHEEGGNSRQLGDSVSSHSRHGHTAKSKEKSTDSTQPTGTTSTSRGGGRPVRRTSSSPERRSVRDRKPTDKDTTQVVSGPHKSEPISTRSRRNNTSGASVTDTRRSRPASADPSATASSRSTASAVEENRPARRSADPTELNARATHDAQRRWGQEARAQEAAAQKTAHTERGV